MPSWPRVCTFICLDKNILMVSGSFVCLCFLTTYCSFLLSASSHPYIIPLHFEEMMYIFIINARPTVSCCCIAGRAEGGEEGGSEPFMDRRQWDMSSRRDTLDKSRYSPTPSQKTILSEHAHNILKRWTITWLQRPTTLHNYLISVE